MKRFRRSNHGLPISLEEGCRYLFRLALALALGVLPATSRKERTLSHFYYVNEPSSLSSLQAHAESLSLVSPQWLAAGRTGQLESTVDTSVVEWAREHRIPLMPLLINEKFQPEVAHAVLNDERIESSVIEQVLEVASANRFYGIQLDFEHIPPGDRDAYARFVARFAKACHRRRVKLSVAVPAPLAPAHINPPGPASEPWVTNAQSLAFDYHELAKAADFITLMTYDEYTSPDQPGPVAGLPWVEACLQKTLDLIPRKRLLLGIPLYYRKWSGKSVSEGSYEEAEQLANQWGAKIETDVGQREKILRFGDGANSQVVWLQDAETLQERVGLVRRYGLAGFSAWRLGQEDSAAWKGVFRSAPGRYR